MRLTPIPAISEEEFEANKKIYQSLMQRGYLRHYNVFEEVIASSGYARHNYRGKIKEDIKLTELEVAMICDNGFSWFGGTSVIHPDRTFYVVIYFD